MSGDDRILPNTITLEMLRKYRALVPASPGSMSAAQVRLVLDYLAGGGYVVAWGSIGEADELVQFDIERPPEWRQVQTVSEHRVGAGTVLNLSREEIGREYFTARTASARERIVNALARVASPDVSIGASEVVAMLYQHATEPVLVVHLVNYNYGIDNDSVAAFNNLPVRIRLPEGFRMDGTRVRLLSPDLTEPADVPRQVDPDGTVLLVIPRLEFYGVLVIEPDPAAARPVRSRVP